MTSRKDTKTSRSFSVMDVQEFHEKLEQVGEVNNDTLTPSFAYDYGRRVWVLTALPKKSVAASEVRGCEKIT